MIVMQKIKPAITKPKASSNPPKINQTILAIGCASNCVLTVFPNGRITNLANLKHCFPNGIPMIVMHQNKPKKKYPIASHKPIKMH